MSVSAPIPDYGRRLLADVIDDAAATDPDHIVYSFTRTDDPADGFYRVSNQRYAAGVDRLAWLIADGFGPPPVDTVPSIGYIGPSMLSTYLIFLILILFLFFLLLFFFSPFLRQPSTNSPDDLRYAMLAVAAGKAGYTVGHPNRATLVGYRVEYVTESPPPPPDDVLVAAQQHGGPPCSARQV